MSRPAAVPITMPCSELNGASSDPGRVLVCQAGTSLIQPQSNSTVPPRLGSLRFSIPCPFSHSASSTMATQWAPVRLATGTASAMWSAWPWVIAMWVGSTSSPVWTAAGLFGLRKGSTSTVVSPSLSSKQECPWYLISISALSSGIGSVRWGQLFLQCPADRDPNHHPHPRLLGEQGADGGEPLLGVGHGRGLQRLRLVRLAEPAALGQRRGENLLQLRRRLSNDPLGFGEALRVEQALYSGLKVPLVRHSWSLFRVVQRRGSEAGETADHSPDQACDEVRRGDEDRQGDQDHRRHRDADRVVVFADRVVGLGAADREPGGDGAECHPVTAGDHGEFVLGVGGDAGRQHPQRPAGDEEDRGRPVAEAALYPGPEDRQPDRDDEEVADVGVGEGGGENPPELVFDREDEAAEGFDRVAARLLDQQQNRRGEDDRDRRVGPIDRDVEARSPWSRHPPPALAPRLLRRELVAAPLQLRRPLAQPGPAVGALGYVGTDL